MNAKIQSMYDQEKGDRTQADEDSVAKIKNSKTIITNIGDEMTARAAVIEQLKTGTSKNADKIKKLLDTLEQQQDTSQEKT